MSSSAVLEWDNEYARVARLASQLRTTGFTSGTADVTALQAGLQRLDQSLDRNLASLLPTTEIQRRKRLVQHLQQTSSLSGNNNTGALGSTAMMTGGPGYPQPQQQSQMTMAMRRQDDMIDELAVGVGRLKNQTMAIGEEAKLHVNLLNDMETNLDAAHEGLEDETRRATRLREDQSVWRLQMTVAGLCILLVLLILLGLS